MNYIKDCPVVKLYVNDIAQITDDSWVDIYEWSEEKGEIICIYKDEPGAPNASDDILRREIDVIYPEDGEDRDGDGYTERVLSIMLKDAQI